MKRLLRRKGYKLFTRPHELNIVGLRSPNTIPNSFDDELHVFYKTDALNWEYHVFKATTDPGTYWLRNPLSPQGTAILSEGQYLDTYAIGMHRGKYKALTQQLKPVTVIRDYDRDATLDFFNGRKATGWFGINIHHASSNGTTKTVDRYSAGCQVLANIEDFNQFMKMCEVHRNHYGNKFTYTLIDMRAFNRTQLRSIVLGSAAAVGLGLLAYFTFND